MWKTESDNYYPCSHPATRHPRPPHPRLTRQLEFNYNILTSVSPLTTKKAACLLLMIIVLKQKNYCYRVQLSVIIDYPLDICHLTFVQTSQSLQHRQP